MASDKKTPLVDHERLYKLISDKTNTEKEIVDLLKRKIELVHEIDQIQKRVEGLKDTLQKQDEVIKQVHENPATYDHKTVDNSLSAYDRATMRPGGLYVPGRTRLPPWHRNTFYKCEKTGTSIHQINFEPDRESAEKWMFLGKKVQIKDGAVLLYTVGEYPENCAEINCTGNVTIKAYAVAECMVTNNEVVDAEVHEVGFAAPGAKCEMLVCDVPGWVKK